MKSICKSSYGSVTSRGSRKSSRAKSRISELLKACKNESVKKLVEVADELLQGKEMPESWRKNKLIQTDKEKIDKRSRTELKFIVQPARQCIAAKTKRNKTVKRNRAKFDKETNCLDRILKYVTH